MQAPITSTLSRIESGAASGGDLEGAHLDFKTEGSTLKETAQDLAEAALCFANASGGTIVVGIHDKRRGDEAFVSTELDPAIIRARIYELTEPPLTVEAEALQYSGHRLVVIRVGEGLAVHTTRKGAATRRVESQCLPMRPEEIARITEERRGADWSENSSGREISEVDPVAETVLRSYLTTAGKEQQRRLAPLELPAVLQELGLLVTGATTLNHAGAILLCGPRAGENHEVLVYQHRRTTAGESDLVRRWQAPSLIAFRECLELISSRTTSYPLTTSTGQQLTLSDFSPDAIREALGNALIHGDLRGRRPVTIEHSPEQLSITSPGPLVTGITPANILTHGSKPRFRALARAMRSIGLAEELGQGVDRMYREAVKSGQDTPSVAVIDGDAPETVVQFKAGPPNTRLARFLAEMPPDEQNDTDALLITHLLCTRKSVSATEVAPVIQRSVEDAQAALHRLAAGDAQILEATTGTVGRRNPRYRFTGPSLARLGSAVAYSRRNRSDSDRKVIEHIRDYGTINNATLQRLFDVDVYAARDMLQELVGREILVRVSSQTRGKSVRYGPGPRFPTKATRRRGKAEPQLPLDE
ncbi:RNA-binding domain-containing protein [Propionicicella superfundia]|uniref:RNA-binding domain-containing protein n=1 Tax=Propionicicella superfundia TaxID=348582 RepID=UPI0004282747|nr:RNA-binding domain-containing protein [Propionicicella superfundia]